MLITVDIASIVEQHLKNCGIGSGGFQPGNQCARGGGSIEGLSAKEKLERLANSFTKHFGGSVAVTATGAATVLHDRRVTALLIRDKVEVLFSQKGSFEYQGKDLQKGTLEIKEKLKSFVKDIAQQGFKISYSASDEQRDRLYANSMTRIGLVRVSSKDGEEIWEMR